MTELQAKLLRLLKELDRLCRKHEVSYYLVGGSLIGALRHEGFVPWDDDADVVMTRDDWKKFYPRVLEDLPDGIRLNSRDSDPSLPMPIQHFTDNTTTLLFRYAMTTPEETGVTVDILILDPVPDNAGDREDYVRALTEYMEITNPLYWYATRTGRRTAYQENCRRIKRYGAGRVLDEITGRAFSYPDGESAFYAQRFANSPHFWPKQVFGKPQYVPFEDTMLAVPERAGDCLRIGFDEDWMFIPQEGPEKSVHEYCIRSMTIPCRQMLPLFDQQVNRKELIRLVHKRKSLQIPLTEELIALEAEKNRLREAHMQLVYRKKLQGIDLGGLVKAGGYEVLGRIFADYMQVQFSPGFVGSSSLNGWTNWYRKCNPVLIDIGDSALEAVFALLIHRQELARFGKLLRARKAAARPMPPEFAALEKMYQAVCLMRSHYECHEDGACRKILEEWKTRCPDNAFFCKQELLLLFRESSMSTGELEALVEERLAHYPDDAEYLELKAECCIAEGKLQDAAAVYEKLLENCTNGLVLLRVRKRLEAFLQTDPGNERYVYLIGKIQTIQRGEYRCGFPRPGEAEEGESSSRGRVCRVRRQLLEGFDRICRENGVVWFLPPEMAQAAVSAPQSSSGGEFAVYMDADNARKLMKAFTERRDSPYYLDSMKTNGQFPRFCLKFGDSRTLDASFPQMHISKGTGIALTIEILRHPSKSAWRNRVRRILELGWECRTAVAYSSSQAQIGRVIVNGLCLVMGPEKTGRKLFRSFMNGSGPQDRKTWYIGGTWKPMKKYPVSCFDTPGDPAADGVTAMISEAAAAGAGRITDAGLSGEEYFAWLENCGIDRFRFRERNDRFGRRYAKIRTLSGKIDRFWEQYRRIAENAERTADGDFGQKSTALDENKPIG